MSLAHYKQEHLDQAVKLREHGMKSRQVAEKAREREVASRMEAERRKQEAQKVEKELIKVREVGENKAREVLVL